MTMLLKALGPNRECVYEGAKRHGSWPKPGVWTTPIEPVVCSQGWHLCTPDQMLGWLPHTGCDLWEVEAAGRVSSHTTQHAVEQARLVRRLNWTQRTERLFAADCAEAVLVVYEAAPPEPRPEWISEGPEDHRLRVAIEVARRFAHGEVGTDELLKAEETAWEAAYSSLGQRRYAAEAAAWAVHTGHRPQFGRPLPLAYQTAAKALEAGADRHDLGQLLVNNITPASHALEAGDLTVTTADTVALEVDR